MIALQRFRGLPWMAFMLAVSACAAGTCPDGSVSMGDACVPFLECPTGQVRSAGECMATAGAGGMSPTADARGGSHASVSSMGTSGAGGAGNHGSSGAGPHAGGNGSPMMCGGSESGAGSCASKCDGCEIDGRCFARSTGTRCDDDNPCTEDKCDEMGRCVGTAVICPGRFACGAEGCRTECSTHADCVEGAVCASGVCVQPSCGDGIVTAGEHCDNGAENTPDAYGPDACTDLCRAAAYCGDGQPEPREQCDQGAGNRADAYGESQCSTECKKGGRCGDGERNGNEACDDGEPAGTAVGDCNLECTGDYQRKSLRATAAAFSTNLGGIVGADAKCAAEFGSAYKALLVGGSRRASVAPLRGDGHVDWVIAKFTHYYNATNQLVWRTDDVPLLGVRGGVRMNLLANAYTPNLGYVWSGYANDWTTIPDRDYKGTCRGWTFAEDTEYGSFALQNLNDGAGEPCGRTAPLLCVEQ